MPRFLVITREGIKVFFIQFLSRLFKGSSTIMANLPRGRVVAAARRGRTTPVPPCFLAKARMGGTGRKTTGLGGTRYLFREWYLVPVEVAGLPNGNSAFCVGEENR